MSEQILVTGNMGYIGPVLGKYLREKDNQRLIKGIDTGYFQNDIFDSRTNYDRYYDIQYFKDVRDIAARDLSNINTVVALSAISNDPMGESFENPTYSINFTSVLEAAKLAKASGVKRFIFASSCSVYGEGGLTAKIENDQLNPLTAYAKSKINCEKELATIADNDFQVVCLRFATACGYSPRLRLDLVLNDFVWTALSTGKVEVLSDGTPLRPLIDVTDMSRAIDWSIGYGFQDAFTVLNCGYNSCNYSVREIAEQVAEACCASVSINLNAAPDRRSYRVNFTQFEKLSGFSSPLVDLMGSIQNLKQAVQNYFELNGNNNNYKERYKRLNSLNHLTKNKILTLDLKWTK